MKVQSSIMQDNIWFRDFNNDIQRVTLRRNFVEKANEDGKCFEFDEVDVFVKYEEGMVEKVTQNFDKLFEIGVAMEGIA